MDDIPPAFNQPDAAAVSGLFFQKITFVAGTGLNLRLEHPRTAQGTAGSDPFGLVRGIGDAAFGNIYTVTAENSFGLVLVNVHKTNP